MAFTPPYRRVTRARLATKNAITMSPPHTQFFT